MKPASLMLGLLVVALGLAVAPNASAEIPLPTDIPYCVTPDCEPVACVLTSCGPHDQASDVPSCKPVDRSDGGIHTTVSSDCRTQVDIKTYDCVWNCGWHDVVRTPYLTIRHYGQNDGEASSSASAIELPGPCGPTAYCTGPECPAVDVSTTDFFAYLGPHAGVTTTSDCQASVQERGLHCAIGTGEVERAVGPVTVGADVCMPELDCTCDPVLEPAPAASLQVVPSGCGLRQATPEPGRTLVWGSDPYDCTVDVDPAYECVGGWGFDRHVTVAFVDAVVRVCTGGPFPPPIVQSILDAIQLE